jgi:hypothetical protein
MLWPLGTPPAPRDVGNLRNQAEPGKGVAVTSRHRHTQPAHCASTPSGRPTQIPTARAHGWGAEPRRGCGPRRQRTHRARRGHRGETQDHVSALANATKGSTRARESSDPSAISRAIMAAKAAHDFERRPASAPIAGANRSARAVMVSTSSARHSTRSIASKAGSPTQGAGSIATRPRSSPPSRTLTTVRSPWRRTAAGASAASRIAS